MGFKKLTRRIALLVGLIIVFAGVAAAGQDDESREISDRWSVRLGSAMTDSTTDLAAGNTLGALIRLEDVFGFDKKESSLGIEGWYRFRANKKGKHRLWFSYVSLSRESAGTVSASVPLFDYEFNADFQSEYDTSLMKLVYQYSLIKTARGEAGITAGLSIYEYDFTLSGSANDGMGGASEFVTQQADVLAPIPTFGFFLTYAVTPDLIFYTSMSSLDIKLSGIEGRVLNTNAQLTWYFTRHVGVGLGIARSSVNITDAESAPAFKVDSQLNAATLAFSAVF